MILPVLLVLACGGTGPTTSPPPDEPAPAALQLALASPSGDGQIMRPGRTLTQPLRVVVTRNSTPVPGVRIDWSTTSGRVVATGPTDADGIATAIWTTGLGTRGRLRAWAEVPGERLQFTSDAVPPILQIIEGDYQSGIVGTQLETPIRARLTWRGTPLVGETVEWHGEGLGPSSTTTDASGDVTTTWQLPTTAGPRIGYAFLPGEGTSSPWTEVHATARPGAPATLAWADAMPGASRRLWQRGKPGWVVENARVADLYDNNISGVPVSWVLRTEANEVLETSTTVTDGQGHVGLATYLQAGERASDFELTVAVDGLSPIRRAFRLVDFIYADINGFGSDWVSTSATIRLGETVRLGSNEPHDCPFQLTEVVPSTGVVLQDLGSVGSLATSPDWILDVRLEHPGTYQLTCTQSVGSTQWSEVLTVVVEP